MSGETGLTGRFPPDPAPHQPRHSRVFRKGLPDLGLAFRLGKIFL